MDTITEDDCCAEKLSEALRESPEMLAWTCLECGTEWRYEVYQLDPGEGVRHWAPRVPVMIFRR